MRGYLFYIALLNLETLIYQENAKNLKYSARHRSMFAILGLIFIIVYFLLFAVLLLKIINCAIDSSSLTESSCKSRPGEGDEERRKACGNYRRGTATSGIVTLVTSTTPKSLACNRTLSLSHSWRTSEGGGMCAGSMVGGACGLLLSC